MESLLMVVADGMGGQAGGAIAAEMAVDACVSALQQASANPLSLEVGLQAANAAIARAIKADVALADMGSTLLVVAVTGDRFTWLSVGDSILWHWRAGQLNRLNADHSMRSTLLDLVEIGRITPEQYAADPRKSMLNSAVTGEDIRMMDVPLQSHSLQEGDLLLLATDGVQTLNEPALAALVGRSRDALTLVEEMLEKIQGFALPGQDNTTVAVYRHCPTVSIGQRWRQMEAPTVRRDKRPVMNQATTTPIAIVRAGRS